MLPAAEPIPIALLLLACWFFLSGLDDLFIDAVWLWSRLKQRSGEAPPARPAPERPVAIFVPLWREHAVIGDMLEHNLAAIRYSNYEVFAGTYPNDDATIEAVRQAETRFPKVHLCLCPHGGPTSKADCLNWIYDAMQAYEASGGARFELVLIHDAEDLIHPDELSIVSRQVGRYAMVQMPVLPLQTPACNLTHGVYCDEFAEYQTKDIPARQTLGGFLPSNGVGTAYTREALEALAASNDAHVFDPECLTEDYDNGFRLHRLGFPQRFEPIRFLGGAPVATREYFPRTFRQALRQRTRWITGNALQAWQRHGWRGGRRQLYWLWRDRKGLAGNAVTLLANALLALGAAMWIESRWTGAEWPLARAAGRAPAALLLHGTLGLLVVRIAVRMTASARIYGWPFALGVPVRILWANALNALATFSALGRYAAARLGNRPLVWLKTDHTYPSPESVNAPTAPLPSRLGSAAEQTEPRP